MNVCAEMHLFYWHFPDPNYHCCFVFAAPCSHHPDTRSGHRDEAREHFGVRQTWDSFGTGGRDVCFVRQGRHVDTQLSDWSVGRSQTSQTLQRSREADNMPCFFNGKLLCVFSGREDQVQNHHQSPADIFEKLYLSVSQITHRNTMYHLNGEPITRSINQIKFSHWSLEVFSICSNNGEILASLSFKQPVLRVQVE